MSFLDDLKKQAEVLRARQGVDLATLQAKMLATETACQLVFKYWVDLANQLSVIRPTSAARFVFDSKATFEGLRLSNFRPDTRNRSLGGRSVTDHVALYWDIHTGQSVALTKDFVNDVDRLESRLTQAGIRFTPDVVRHPDTQKLIKVHYNFEVNIHAQVRLQPDHEVAEMTFTVSNADGLNRWVIAFAAPDVTVALMDELAKWLVGQPHHFRNKGRVLDFREW